MSNKIFKSILVVGFLTTVNLAWADFAVCPSASDAQKIINSAASSLTAVATPNYHWLDALSSDS